MNKTANKHVNRKGFTLIEILATVIILVLLVVGIGTIMNSAMKVYDESIFDSDAAVLSDILDTSIGDVLRYSRNLTVGTDLEAPYNGYATTSPLDSNSKLRADAFYFTNLDYGVKNGYISLGEDGYLYLKSTDSSGDPSPLVNAGSYANGIGVKSISVEYYPQGVKASNDPDFDTENGGSFIVTYVISENINDENARSFERCICIRSISSEVDSNASSGSRTDINRGETHKEDKTERVIRYIANNRDGDFPEAKLLIGSTKVDEYSQVIKGSVTLLTDNNVYLLGKKLIGWQTKFEDSYYTPGDTVEFSGKTTTLYAVWADEDQALTVNGRNGASVTVTYKDSKGASHTETVEANGSATFDVKEGSNVTVTYAGFDKAGYAGYGPKANRWHRGEDHATVYNGETVEFTMEKGSYTLDAYLPYLVTWSLEGTPATWEEDGSQVLIKPCYDVAIDIPKAVYKGHDVASWTSDPEGNAPSRRDTGYKASGNVTLTPAFEDNSVRFYGDPTSEDGRDIELTDPVPYTNIPTSGLPGSWGISFDGWTFLGWFDVFGNKFYSDWSQVRAGLDNGSVDLYAHWVQFDATGAELASAASASVSGTALTLTYPQVSTAENAYFLGWYNESDVFTGYSSCLVDETHKSPEKWGWRTVLGARIVVLAKVTESEDEKISLPAAETLVNQNTGTFKLPDAEYKGHFFLGWWDRLDFGTFRGLKNSEIEVAMAESVDASGNLLTCNVVTLYPRWLSVSADVEGVDLKITQSDITVKEEDGSFTVKLNEENFAGYSFAGWYRVDEVAGKEGETEEQKTLLNSNMNGVLIARSAETHISAALKEKTVYFQYKLDIEDVDSIKEGDFRPKLVLMVKSGSDYIELRRDAISWPVLAVTGTPPIVSTNVDDENNFSYEFTGWTKEVLGGESVDMGKDLVITKAEGAAYEAATYTAHFVLSAAPVTLEVVESDGNGGYIASTHSSISNGSEDLETNKATFNLGVGTAVFTNKEEIDRVRFEKNDVAVAAYGILPDFGYEVVGWVTEYSGYQITKDGLTIRAIVAPRTYTISVQNYAPLVGNEFTKEVTYQYGESFELAKKLADAGIKDQDWDAAFKVVSKVEDAVEGVDYSGESNPFFWQNGEDGYLRTGESIQPYGNVTLAAEWTQKMVNLTIKVYETKLNFTRIHEHSSVEIQKKSGTTYNPIHTIETTDASIGEQNAISYTVSIKSGSKLTIPEKADSMTIGEEYQIVGHEGTYGTRGLITGAWLTNHYRETTWRTTGMEQDGMDRYVRGENPVLYVYFTALLDSPEEPEITFLGGDLGQVREKETDGRGQTSTGSWKDSLQEQVDAKADISISSDKVSFTNADNHRVEINSRAKDQAHYEPNGWTVIMQEGETESISEYYASGTYTVLQNISVRAEFIGVPSTLKAVTSGNGTVNNKTEDSITVHYDDEIVGSATSSVLEIGENKFVAKAAEGYHFVAWEGLPESGKITAEKNATTTITATFAGNAATFNANGGKWADGSVTKTLTYGTDTMPPENPGRDGWTFSGWYASAYDMEGKSPLDSFVPAEDGKTVYYAGWTREKYTVTVLADTNGYFYNAVDAQVSGSKLEVVIFGATEVKFTGSTISMNNTSGNTTTATATPNSGYKFLGWFTGEGENERELKTSVTPTANITITAKFIGNSVTLDAGDGYFDGDETRHVITIPFTGTSNFPTPVRPGYSFVKWQGADDDLLPEDNETFNAVWRANSYQVTASVSTNGVSSVSDGGKLTVTEGFGFPLRAYFDNEVTLDESDYSGTATFVVKAPDAESSETVVITAAANTGYHFAGWAVTDTRTASDSAAYALEAKFEGNAVTFDPNGGAFKDDSSTAARTVNYAKNLAFPEVERSGWILSYWYDASDPEEKQVTAPIASIQSSTYKAKWSRQGYTVTYSADGASLSEPHTVGYDLDSAITLPTATKDYYTFTGWKVTAAAGSWKVNNVFDTNHLSLAAGQYGDVTLTAQWDPKSYTIQYSNGTPDDAPTSYTVEIDLSIPLPTAVGQSLSSWTVTKDAGNTSWDASYDAEDFSEGALYLGTGHHGDVTLTAVWDAEAEPVSIVINTNGASGTAGGSVTHESSTVHYGDTVSKSGNVITIGGKTFTAEAEPGYTLSSFEATAGVSAENKVTGPVTLTANFTGYEVIFDSNGGTVGGTATKTENYGSLTWSTPTRGGYTFDYWTDASGAQVSKDTYVPTKNETLKAHWTGVGYYFNLNGGTVNGSSDPIKVEHYNGELTFPEPFNPGKKLDQANAGTGWFTAATGGLPVSSNTVPSEGTVYYAHWVDAIYTIQYYDGKENITGEIGDEYKTYRYPGSVNLPTYEGTDSEKVFAGWVPQSDVEHNWADQVYSGTAENVYGDVILEAKWNLKEYTVTYTGTGTEGLNPTIYSFGNPTSASLAEKPMNGDKVFLWWKVDTDKPHGNWGTTSTNKTFDAGSEISKTATGNVTLVAVWAEPIQKVTVKVKDHGSVSVDGSEKTSDITIDVPTWSTIEQINTETVCIYEKNEKDGKTLKTHTLVADGNRFFIIIYTPRWSLNGASNQPITSPIEITADFVFWGADAYVVNVVSEDESKGTIDHSSVSCKQYAGDKYDSVSNVLTVHSSYENDVVFTATAADGYHFVRWSSEEGTVNGNMTITAEFEANKVHFDPNGGTFSDGSTTTKDVIYEGKDIVLAEYGLTGLSRGKDTFTGWYLGNEGPLYSSFAPLKHNVTYTAEWNEKNSYIIYQDENGNSLNFTKEYKYTDNVALATESSLPAAVRNGYTLTSWNITAKDEGANWTGSYIPGASVGTGKFGDVYAKGNWTPKTYTISYSLANGETISSASGTYTAAGNYNIETSLKFPIAAKTGYTFAGWKVTSAAGNWKANKVYGTDSLVVGTGFYGDVTLSPVWEAERYTVSFTTDGYGTVSPESVANVPYQTMISGSETAKISVNGTEVTADPSTGYHFKAWTPNGGTVTGAMSIKATFEANTLTYDGNGGSPGRESDAYTGSAVKLPGATREGYTFAGWYTSATDGDWVGDKDSNYEFRENTTLYAHWNINLAVKAGTGGSVNKTSITNIPSGTKITVNGNKISVNGTEVTATPATGYYFKEWNVTNEETVTAPKEITATFTGYTVTYNGNGGTPGRASDTWAGSKVKLPSATRGGYDFSGWFTAATNGTYVGNVGTEYTIEKDTTLYAHWTPKTYTVTVTTDDNGTVAPASVTGISYNYQVNGSSTNVLDVYGTKVTATANPGYHFDHWDPNGLTVTEDKEIKACFAGNTVTYDGNGGTPARHQDTFAGKVTLPGATQDGYTFAGWYSAATGGTKIGDAGAEYTFMDSMTVYAHWNVNIQVIVSGPGSVDKGGISDVPVGSTISVSENTFAVNGTTVTASCGTGYKFTGWSVADGAVVSEPMKVTASFAGCVVTYNGNGGSADRASDSYSGSAVTLPGASRTGYDFVGWYTAASGGNRVGSAGDSYTITADTILYAQWTPKSYSLTFSVTTNADSTNQNGGSISPVPGAVKYGQMVTKALSKDGKHATVTIGETTYNIVANDGFYIRELPEITYSGVGSDNKVNGNVTITANFTGYLITYNYNGGKEGNKTSKTENYTGVLSLPNVSYESRTLSDNRAQFARWATAEVGGSEVTRSTIPTADNEIYYAQWTFKVTVNKSSGGSGTTVTGSISGDLTTGGRAYKGEQITVDDQYDYSENHKCSITYYNGRTNPLEKVFEMPDYGVTIAVESDEGSGGGTEPCFAPGTLITLADGSRKLVEEIEYEDKLLAFNHLTGKYEATDILVIFTGYSKEFQECILYFEDGNSIKIINEHGLFDKDLNRYVMINPDNVSLYLNHSFVVYSPLTGGNDIVKLTSYKNVVEENTSYSIITKRNVNAIANGLLTVSDEIEGLYNFFEYEDDLSYNKADMASKIEEYGISPYSDWSAYFTYDQYLGFNLDFSNIAFEMGLTTKEKHIETFLKYYDFVAKN